jgi:hypothetical protein
MSCSDHVRCPSHRCKPGSDLIGVRQDDGTVAILPQPLPVDQHFVDVVSRDAAAPEQRFRFSNKCIESGCSQWTGARCGVIDNVLQLLAGVPSAGDIAPPAATTPPTPKESRETLPPCGIRPTCRWFLQAGADACRVCPYVVTHITEIDTFVPLSSWQPAKE